MSNSSQLRKTLNLNKINKESKNTENMVILSTKKAINLITDKYKNAIIINDKKLNKNDIHLSIKKHINDIDIASNLTSSKSYICPDGGLTYIIANQNKYLIGVVEAKKQGTNDIRGLEGKKYQSKGNAIERVCKNYLEICNFMINEKILPYLIFMISMAENHHACRGG